MPHSSLATTALAAALAALTGLMTARTCTASGPDDPGRQARLEALRAAGTDVSLTILPVNLAGTPSLQVAEVVGAFLEDKGLTNLETTPQKFLAPTDAEFDETSRLLGEFLRENPIETDYALYAEILGSHEKGITAVRSLIVNQAGDLVWHDRQTPHDAAFKHLRPREPMTCCVLLVERLGTVISFDSAAAPPEGQGKFATLFARRAGLPDQAERNAMKRRLETLKNAGSTATVAVYPIRINDGADRPGAEHLAGLLNDAGLCHAKVPAAQPRFKVEFDSNEQKILWDLARAFRQYVRGNPPEADYALYADYILHPHTNAAHAVHFFICDRAGDWVIVDFQNDHHPDFQSINPRTRDDCGRLVTRRLAGYLK